MTPGNLSIVWTPNIFWKSSPEFLEEYDVRDSKANKIVEFLISHKPQIFSEVLFLIHYNYVILSIFLSKFFNLNDHM